jgi:hypothetical protein
MTGKIQIGPAGWLTEEQLDEQYPGLSKVVRDFRGLIANALDAGFDPSFLANVVFSEHALLVAQLDISDEDVEKSGQIFIGLVKRIRDEKNKSVSQPITH